MIKVTGYSLLNSVHEKILPSFSSCRIQACMHAFNLPLKKVAIACNSCTGWVGRVGNLIPVPAVNSLRTKYRLRCQLFPVGRTSYTLYLNSTKTDAGWLEEFSPRRLTVFEIRLDLVAWSVENHLGFG